ncbi:Membrane skeleton protein IMC2A, related [Eimeria necatrix]|uniref:Membrane skeleton protein IMC2A, related n=1 Tax=Eimeria necatrix TaxID=51315 RepID=U6MM76_9EIME|nr:Membrane skeleton protein IMC2A, related [Eimeria necatrix]CDJ62760.1 Membrane skeleton protein IMC2A, related [Eimeria necatrix]
MAAGCDFAQQYLYTAVVAAGPHTAAATAAVDCSMEDLLVAFLRSSNWEKEVLLLQWVGLHAALQRAHARVLQQLLRRQQQEQQDFEEDPDREKPLELAAAEFGWLLGQQQRETEWYFDGNTFHKRGFFEVPEKLTDKDLGFLRSLPFNVLRVARGLQQQQPTAAVAHLQQQLQLRGVRTPRDFLLKTNFLDLLFSTSLLEETFFQLDVLEEFIRNWEAYKEGKVGPPAIPGAPGAPGGPQLLQTLSSKKTPRERAPKCPTLLCFAESVWAQRADHPLDKQQQHKSEKGEEVPKETSSESFSELQFHKTSANFLRVLAVGNTGGAPYGGPGGPGGPRGPWGALRRALRLNEFEDTVRTLRDFHQKHNFDVALGLGDFFKPPGVFSVRDEAFRTRWRDIFVKDAGLDIPWYMVNGEAEGALNSSALYRFHYSRQDANFHNPRWLHKAVWTFAANLTTAAGAPQDLEFSVHLISVDTWTLFGGTPFRQSSKNIRGILDSFGHF